MSILPAQKIRRLCKTYYGSKYPLISPFNERSVFEGKSYGLSSCGYDIRIKETLWVWPLWHRLGSSIEYFNIPNNIMGKVMNKSSWARLGLDASMTTNLEPGWCGYLTIELVRHKLWPIKIKAGTPIAQIIFEELSEPTEQPYVGKYQNQEAGPQKARKEH